MNESNQGLFPVTLVLGLGLVINALALHFKAKAKQGQAKNPVLLA